MTYLRFILTTILIALLPLMGCDTVFGTDDDPDPEIGIVAWVDPPSDNVDATASASSILGDYLALSAPDTVEAGVSFDVTVTTLGLNGCWRADREEIETEGDPPTAVTITPYDRLSGDDACTLAIVALPRTIDLQFDAPGTATIRVVGREVDGSDPLDSTLIEIEHELVVVE